MYLDMSRQNKNNSPKGVMQRQWEEKCNDNGSIKTLCGQCH